MLSVIKTRLAVVRLAQAPVRADPALQRYRQHVPLRQLHSAACELANLARKSSTTYRPGCWHCMQVYGGVLAHGNEAQGIAGEVAPRCMQTPTTHYPACTILSTMLAVRQASIIYFRSVIHRFYEMFEVEALMPMNQEADQLDDSASTPSAACTAGRSTAGIATCRLSFGEPERLAAMVLLH